MKSRKILLVIFIIFSSAIGLAVMNDFAFNENLFVSVDDYPSSVKKIVVKVSDGVGTSSKG